MPDEDKNGIDDSQQITVNKKHALIFICIGALIGNSVLAVVTKYAPSLSFLTDIAASQVCNEQITHITSQFSASISELNVKVAKLEMKICMMEGHEDC